MMVGDIIPIGIVIFLFRKCIELDSGITASAFCRPAIFISKWLLITFFTFSAIRIGIDWYKYGNLSINFQYQELLILLKSWAYIQVIILIYLMGCEAGLKNKIE